MQNDKLLPCPFCGGEAEWGTVLKTWIACRSCGFETPYSRDTENTVRLWNTRKPMERIVEQLEERKLKTRELHGKPHMDYGTLCGIENGINESIKIVRKGGVDNAE